MIPQLTKNQINWCKKFIKSEWEFNFGYIDVNGNVDIEHCEIKEIPVVFGTVYGRFHCGFNSMSSLKGSPHTVIMNYWCDYNNITSLIGGPKRVYGNFGIEDNFLLESLEGLPEELGGKFLCNNTPLLPQWTHDLVEEYNTKKITYKEFRGTYLKLLASPGLQQGKNLGLW